MKQIDGGKSAFDAMGSGMMVDALSPKEERELKTILAYRKKGSLTAEQGKRISELEEKSK